MSRSSPKLASVWRRWRLGKVHKVVYLPLAEADILAAVDYIAGTLDAPKAAAELLDELDRTVGQIARFPYSAQLYRTDRPMKDELRMIPVKGYILYYAVFPDCVEIRRFLHGRRNRQNPSLFT